MKIFLILAFTLLFTACSGSDSGSDKKTTLIDSGNGSGGKTAITNSDIPGCVSSSDYDEFACIHINDFVSANGSATAMSRSIAQCTILFSNDNACPLGKLGFIAAKSTNPSKQQILDKLIVSHPWMADNFASFLDSMPADMFNLFASVTAIVIHADIRPAFFWRDTGAIYIDPYYLWLTAEEFTTISEEEDYRSNFGAQLNFISLNRYVKNGSYAFTNSDGSRNSTQAAYALSAVLFHELAHARDFFPTANILAATESNIPTDIIVLNGNASNSLSTTYPLTNTTLFNLAQVQYKGKTPTNDLTVLTASNVGSLFASDGANDDYSYSTTNEDTAMLFEEIMMKIYFDIDREIAFASELVDEPETCADLNFAWFDINRYADVNVIHRVQLVVDMLLPSHSHQAFLANPIADGTFNWCGATAARGFTQTDKALTFDFWH